MSDYSKEISNAIHKYRTIPLFIHKHPCHNEKDILELYRIREKRGWKGESVIVVYLKRNGRGEI